MMQANLKIADPTLAEIGFLRTELLTGLTLARIAIETTSRQTADRNRALARKAYDAILHFLPKVKLSSDEAKEIQSTLEQLQLKLRRLGEKI